MEYRFLFFNCSCCFCWDIFVLDVFVVADAVDTDVVDAMFDSSSLLIFPRPNHVILIEFIFVI